MLSRPEKLNPDSREVCVSLDAGVGRKCTYEAMSRMLGQKRKSCNFKIDHLPKIVPGFQQLNEPPPSVYQNIRHETIYIYI